MSAQHAPVLVPIALCAMMAPLAAFASGTGPRVDPPNPQVPTAIELALIQRRCNVADTLSATTDAQQECLAAQLVSLRGEFGRDLGRLSASDRRNMDVACSRLRPAEQQEAYLGCISEQLAAWHNRQARGNVIVSDAAAPVVPDIAPDPAALATSSGWSALAIGGIVGIVAAAIGVVLFAARPRRIPRKCRVCAADVLNADLCPTCRREAAEALRRSTTDRAHNQDAREEEEEKEEEERREHVSAAELPEPTARDDQEVRVPSAVAAITLEPAMKDTRDEDESDGVFDPYVVLGVSPEAGQDEVRSAYEQAKTKYEPTLVSHLGDEAQAHFKAKAQSVERAYQMLAGM